ncbi:MAG: hypothetical protein C4297_11520 [Gemmataceae bacterium]
MSGVLFAKILRDIRWPLTLVTLLLAAYQFLWAKITQRITEELLPAFTQHLPIQVIKALLFQGPGRIVQTLMGGDTIDLQQPMDMLSVGYIHPLTQTILCIWAMGRAASALAGELDRGTLELLLAQPIARSRVIGTHLFVDLATIPLLCSSLYLGTVLGVSVFGLSGIDLAAFTRALVNVAAFLFALSGGTMALSAMGRFRWKVLSWSLGVALVGFLVNLFGQMWPVLAPFRPLTMFYYYQPQLLILKDRWWIPISGPDLALGTTAYQVPFVGVLVFGGLLGYAVALGVFTRRDLPAPL